MAIGTMPNNVGNLDQRTEWQGSPGGGALPENAGWPDNFGQPAVFGLSGGEGASDAGRGPGPFTQKLRSPLFPDSAQAGTAQAGAVYTGYPGNSPTRTDRAVSSLFPPKLEMSEG